MRSIDRRTFMRAAAGSALGLPIARSLLAADAGPPPRRLVIFMQNNGTQQASFWPGESFTSPILEPLLASPAIAAKTSVVRGIHVPADDAGTDGNQHDVGFARMFTGAKLLSIGGRPWGGSVSVDQIVARHLRLNSLTLAVLASSLEPHPKPGFEHRRSFSYLGPGRPKSPTVDPLIAYQQLFTPLFGGDGSGQLDPATRDRLERRASVLDAVARNLQEVRARLTAAERAKVDLHLTSVRELENQLSSALETNSLPGFGGRGARCSSRPASPPEDLAPTGLLVSSDDAIPRLVSDMVDLATTALICDVTRVATIQLGYGGGKWRYAWEGIDMNCHDEVAHRDTSDAGSSADNNDRLVRIGRFHARAVARMAEKLDAVPEGAGTMLDNTLIVWANELGRGDHDLSNIPIVLVGRAAGALPHGGRVIDRGRQVFNRLGCTILNLMGMESAGFGDVSDCGTIDGLTIASR